MHKQTWACLGAALILTFLWQAVPAAIDPATEYKVAIVDAKEGQPVEETAAQPLDTLTLHYTFGDPQITHSESGDQITLDGLPSSSEPGEPALPYRMARILLPSGYALDKIAVAAGPQTAWPDPVRPALAQQQRPLCAVSDDLCIDAPDQPLRGSTPASERVYELLSTQTVEGYTLLLLRLFPVQYHPEKAQMWYTGDLYVTLHLQPTFGTTHLSPSTGAQARIRSLVDNPEMLTTYTPSEPSAALQQQRLNGLVQSADPYDYVIITSETLSPTFQSLADWRTGRGLKTRIVSVQEIYAAYAGTRPDGGTDNATRIRAFITDAYTTWYGTPHPLKYVLLGGDVEIIPVRYVSVEAGIYSSNALISDAYYAGLDGTWDQDADGEYGEGAATAGGGGTAGEEVDFYAEVYTGRAPVSTATEATHFINKVIAYESDPAAAALDKGLMLGERLDSQTYGGYSMDELIALAPALNATRLYDRDASWSSATLIPYLNASPHLINHLGHANQSMVMRLSPSQVSSLSNTTPFLVHTQGCLPAKFDASDSIGEYFVFSEHGAFGFIGNTQYGWYLPGSTNGASQLFHRAFMKALFEKRIQALGEVLQDAKEEALGYVGGAGPERWVALELTLLGDPATAIVTDYVDPVAAIDTPVAASSVAGMVTIEGSAHSGSAAGAGFDSYRLDYGSGLYPGTWTQIGATATVPLTQSVLGTWDTGLLPDGKYSLRLTVADSTGLTGIDQMALTLNHTDLTDPKAGTFIRGGPTYPITGTATRGDFQSYTLILGRGTSPDSWTAVFSSTTAVVDGLLGLWNTGTITEADTYTLRLQAKGTAYEGTDTVSLVVDPLYQEGWPQAVEQRLSETALAIGDLEGDGDLEIVAAEGMVNCGGALEGGRCGAYGMRVYAWHHDGTPVAGWPQMPGSDNRLTSPALADLNADGDLEIIVGSIDGRIYAYEHDGTPVSGWPRTTGSAIYATPAAADLEGDGALEVVACSYDSKTYAWHHDGTSVAGWPQISGTCSASPLLVDLEGDGPIEIVALSETGIASAFRGNGTAVPGWPISAAGSFKGSPAAADLNGNGSIEIVAPTQNGIYVWQADGTSLTGWPKSDLESGSTSSPALADLNGDQLPEIIMAGGGQTLYVWDAEGNPVEGWGTAKAPAAHSAPVVGDIDGDEDFEILVAGNDYDDAIYAWHHDGTAVAGWPRPIPLRATPGTDWERSCSPVLADVDGDGDTEVGLGIETQLFLWDTNGDASRLPWPTFKANQARTGVLLQLTPSVTLTGQISDSTTALPISGATVTVTPGPTAITDPQGHYTMTLVSGAHRTITAQAAGYGTKTLTEMALITETITLDFTLEPLQKWYFPLVAHESTQ